MMGKGTRGPLAHCWAGGQMPCAMTGPANSRLAAATIRMFRVFILSQRSSRPPVPSALAEVELGAGADAGRPARCHRLQAGIEMYAFGAVNAMRAENGRFPAAEGMKADRHRDRHID